MTGKLAEEEHHARAALMGMLYHHGNGDPVYYKVDEYNIAIIESFIDANTLEPLIQKQAGRGEYVNAKMDWKP